MKVKVLDHGFVKLIEHMGNDTSVVQAARVSYGQGSKGEEKDNKLIGYLLKHGHLSPFEQVVFKFHIKAPIFVMRQWFRHRTARINEKSGRYTRFTGEYYIPFDLRLQDNHNKQGSAGKLSRDEELLFKNRIEKIVGAVFSLYHDLLKSGVSRELARTVLPMSVYTEAYWQIDLRNLFNFLKQRNHSHAQEEIRKYAEVIENMVSVICPVSLKEYRNVFLGKSFTVKQLEAIKELVGKGNCETLLSYVKEVI